MKENLYTPDCIRTFTGIYMNVFEPTLEMICIEDIAHALSYQCRFAGHLPIYYSVAQHSVLTSQRVDQKHKIAALLHDASEAYLMDIPSPIKKRLANYKEIEDKLMLLISQKFGFKLPLHDDIKEADNFMLQWEWSTLMLKEKVLPPLGCLSSKESEKCFLSYFSNLTK